MKKLLGSSLRPEVQRAALARFVHRYTGQHKSAWASRQRHNGEPYPLQFKDDADWLANTIFVIKGDGTLNNRSSSCASYPTWPNNPECRRYVVTPDGLSVKDTAPGGGVSYTFNPDGLPVQTVCDTLNAGWQKQLLSIR